MVFYQRNYYKLKQWTSCACGSNTNGYLFTYPPSGMHIMKAFYDTQSNEDYAAFLSECDFTGTRKELNKKMYLNKLRKDLWEKLDLSWDYDWRGIDYVNKKVEKYARKNGLLFGDEYPVWRKPVIKQIPAESVFWEFDTVHNSYICLNDDILQEYGKKCDILLLGEELEHQMVVCVSPSFAPVGDYWKLKISQIQGKPSEEFIKKHPNWASKDFNMKKAYIPAVRNMSRSKSVFELSDMMSSSGTTIASSWDDEVMNHKMGFRAINISPEVFGPVRVSLD